MNKRALATAALGLTLFAATPVMAEMNGTVSSPRTGTTTSTYGTTGETNGNFNTNGTPRNNTFGVNGVDGNRTGVYRPTNYRATAATDNDMDWGWLGLLGLLGLAGMRNRARNDDPQR
jgi:MYXO-CTERM domain-containing protein